MEPGISTRLPPAADLSRTLAEARAIADGVGQPLTTAHLLLALFTVPNPAEVVLGERGVDEDTFLALLKDGRSQEAGNYVRKVLDQAEQTALRCDAAKANTLHLLVGFLRVRESIAYWLLEQSVDGLPQFRNQVMSFVTGVLPRRLRQPMQDARASQKRIPGVRETRPRLADPNDDWVVPRSTWVDPGPPESLEGDEVTDDAAKPAKQKTRPLPEPTGEPMWSDEESDYPDEPSVPPEPTSKRFHITRAPTLPPTDYDLDPDKFPWLTSLGRNLTSLAQHGELDPVIGRSAEITQIIDVLGKRRANNPCLVGEPGVGKTAIAEGLAVKLVAGDPDVLPLMGKVVIELDMGRITAGTALRGSFSERMQGLKKDVERARGKVIVFIDEIHTLMGAGSSGESPQDASNELKAALARGAFPCIGSTTFDEYKKHIEADPAMERRFVRIQISEPDDEACIEIMRGAAPLYENHHGVRVTDDGISSAVQLASRFIHDRKLPGKALDLLDLAMSRAKRAGERTVTRKAIARVTADVAKVPLERIELDDAARFLEIEGFLKQKVIGHEPVIERVGESIRRNYAGFTTQRPMGSFLFLGPTGVGKTELAKAMADFLFGSSDAMIRLDMSEFGESHTAARLVGAPPGYVGHTEGGQLTEAIRRRPHSLVLLDEIEKAHAEVLPLLLQILDEGRLTDAKGRTVTFRHSVVVMTSNLGASVFGKKKTRAVGFAAPSEEDKSTVDSDAVLEAARGHFLPELWGRIDDKLVFAPLTADQLERIAALLLAESARHLLTTRSIAMEWDDVVLALLAKEAGDLSEQGARHMRRAVQRLVESPLAEAILKKQVHEGDRIRLREKDGNIIARRVAT